MSSHYDTCFKDSKVAERLNAPVSKTGIRETVSWVRIPSSHWKAAERWPSSFLNSAIVMKKIFSHISYENFQASRKFMEQKGSALMHHEKKDGAKVGVPINNYLIYGDDEIQYYLVRSNVFMHLVDGMIMEAKDQFPEYFGTGDASDVIDGLLKHYPYGEKDWYIDFLKDEQFCYIMQLKNGTFSDKILRVDLFRQYKENAKGKKEFVGGLFHMLKHFSHGGIPLSTGKGETEIVHINELLTNIAIAFFTNPHIEEQQDSYVIKVSLSEKYQLRIVLYYEVNTGVYFIRTAHKEALGK